MKTLTLLFFLISSISMAQECDFVLVPKGTDPNNLIAGAVQTPLKQNVNADRYKITNATKMAASTGVFSKITMGSENMTRLIGYPRIHVCRTNNQTISYATATVVGFNYEMLDDSNTFNPTTSRWTPGVIGKYYIDAFVLWNVNPAATVLYAWFRVNGGDACGYASTDPDHSGINRGLNVSAIVDVGATNQYVELIVYQLTDAAYNQTVYGSGSYYTSMRGFRISD